MRKALRNYELLYDFSFETKACERSELLRVGEMRNEKLVIRDERLEMRVES